MEICVSCFICCGSLMLRSQLFPQSSIWKVELVENNCLYCFQFHCLPHHFVCKHICYSSSTSLRVKAHLVFSVFTNTTVYSFFFDKANGKPDLYSLISCAAVAIMLFSLSTQTHFGFEVDLLYFFCGYLTLQVMKIKYIYFSYC